VKLCLNLITSNLSRSNALEIALPVDELGIVLQMCRLLHARLLFTRIC
jgi:hypothetical protein